MNEVRAWGAFTILSEDSKYKVKKIEVQPGHRLSYQSHDLRSEFWVVVSGSSVVTIDDSKFAVKYGETVHIPVGAKHRIENIGDDTLVFIEVQTGSSFSEEDIVRYDDDYGRV